MSFVEQKLKMSPQYKVQLDSPLSMPNAGGFLWNSKMMIQMNCRGYAVSQFMQPEPAKYSNGPNNEAKTFMQPEHHYYTHHPGRFFYIKDESSNELFSVPYEPVRSKLEQFSFIVTASEVLWTIKQNGLEITLVLSLTKNDVVELWQLRVKNLTDIKRNISIYPYFSIGYMSWMNQSAVFNEKLNGIIASSITPYQKVEDHFKQQNFKDKTYLIADIKPTAWCANQNSFEGEGGLHNPDAIQQVNLDNSNAVYETPLAALQYSIELNAQGEKSFKFIFGPAEHEDEIAAIKHKFFEQPSAFDTQKKLYLDYINQAKGCIDIETPDSSFNEFINHWLPRQMFYHGDVNRLSTDPQTRNYLQDAMGMCYIDPSYTRKAFITALSQQTINGEMPDGILLHPDAKLKYINQIPHADHSVWLPICLLAYLDETNDYNLLNELVGFANSGELLTVKVHIDLAMQYILNQTDERGLSFIAQGDWCDPMNMVGFKGKGVSAWLSMATAYALNTWCDICEDLKEVNQSQVNEFRYAAKAINNAINQYFWDGQWFARGITDDNVTFGINSDVEGRIFINPQSWAMLSGTADDEQINKIITQVNKQLMTPYGVMMLAPSYTKMRNDVGRITQKSPGVAENGSVYNHAAIFYAFSLYSQGQADLAFDVLIKMLPSETDETKRGQLPIFIPNYYRGAYYQLPQMAGRSSQLFNTGTVAWFYRCLIEGLCGLKGDKGDLVVQPQLPKHWPNIKVIRHFQGAVFNVEIIQSHTVLETKLVLDSIELATNKITNIAEGKQHKLIVITPYLVNENQNKKDASDD